MKARALMVSKLDLETTKALKFWQLEGWFFKTVVVGIVVVMSVFVVVGLQVVLTVAFDCRYVDFVVDG
jgi:hypothetical protein